LCTPDPEAAFAFYSSLFGWTKGHGMDMGPMGTYQMFQRDGMDIGGMMKQPPNVPAPFWNYYVEVEEATGAAEKIKATGGQVLHGPAEVPGPMYIVQGMDPQGAVFALVSAKA
jgi:predicted enzyme related to lactoylglutathione lyase